MYRIMMVEDDEIIAKTVKEHLESWEYSVHVVQDLSKVMVEFANVSPQLVLMDIKLPFFNGYHWCSEIRKVSHVPVIFLSSASDNMNIVMAVNMGGDDFVSKPFDLDVLTAKITALLRRSYDFAGNSLVLEHRGAILNVSEASISYGEEKIELTKNELHILNALMEKLWESDNYVDDNTLSVNVNRLRKKLESIGLKDFITTKKGIGYRIS